MGPSGRPLDPLDERASAILGSTEVISEMMTDEEIAAVLERLGDVLREGVAGDVVELGCSHGTTSIFIAKLLEQAGSRSFHVYDSLAGLPESSERDRGPGAADLPAGAMAVTRAALIANLEAAGVARLPEIHEGFFEQLGPDDLPDQICFAFLDGDLYDSIQTSLELVYPRLSTGGAVVIDDLGSDAFPGVARACADFLAGRPESVEPVDGLSMGAFVKD